MIIASFKRGSNKAYTKSVHQFDKGQKLIVTGITLPDSYEVHMSNDREGGIAYSAIGDAEGVYIPDALLMNGEYVYVWLYATSIGHEGTAYGYGSYDDDEYIREVQTNARTIDEGKTEYEIVIPVIRKSASLPAVSIESLSGNFGYMVDENEVLVPVRQ